MSPHVVCTINTAHEAAAFPNPSDRRFSSSPHRTCTTAVHDTDHGARSSVRLLAACLTRTHSSTSKLQLWALCCRYLWGGGGGSPKQAEGVTGSPAAPAPKQLGLLPAASQGQAVAVVAASWAPGSQQHLAAPVQPLQKAPKKAWEGPVERAPAEGRVKAMASTSGAALTAVAQRRIQSELADWMRNPPDGCCLESCEPMTHWVIIMQGPEGGGRLYEGAWASGLALGRRGGGDVLAAAAGLRPALHRLPSMCCTHAVGPDPLALPFTTGFFAGIPPPCMPQARCFGCASCFRTGIPWSRPRSSSSRPRPPTRTYTATGTSALISCTTAPTVAGARR